MAGFNYNFYNWLVEFHQDLYLATRNHHDLPETQQFNPEIAHSSQSEEDYHDCLYFLKGIIAIAQKVAPSKPEILHRYLGDIFKITNDIYDSFCKPDDEAALAYYNKIVEAIRTLNEFLKKYNYKNDAKYQSNTSLLISALLHQRSQPASTENLAPDTKFLKVMHHDQSNQLFSLKDIAEKVITATGANERNIQFIAVGINEEEIYVTSNYHTPAIYRLDDFLHGKNHFSSIKLQRNNFNLDRRIKVTEVGEIHAETMLAALKNKLNLSAILVVDAKGMKVQNCLYCSQYLADKGIAVETHSDRVMNYVLPSGARINATLKWLQYLQTSGETQALTNMELLFDCDNQSNATIENSTYQMLRGLLSAQKQAEFDKHDDELEAIFQQSTHYPHALQVKELHNGRHIKATYHQAKALALPNEKKLTRKSNSGGSLTCVSLPNDRLVLHDDGHLPASRSNPDRFSPRPDSPRSQFFATILNPYIDAANGSAKVKRSDGLIYINRNTRAMT